MGHLKLVEYGRIHSATAASSVAQGLHCASLLRWVYLEEEGVAGEERGRRVKPQTIKGIQSNLLIYR